jgi:hypothetical protein
MLPFFTLGTIEIPDHPVLVRELQMLERNAGTDKIDHPVGLRDDHCTVVSICCTMLTLNGDRPTPGVRAVHASPVGAYARQTPIAPPPKRGLPPAVGRPIVQASGGQGKMPKPWVRSGGGIDPNWRWR